MRRSVFLIVCALLASSCESSTPAAPASPTHTPCAKVISTIPAEGQVGVPLKPSIKMVFSKRMLAGSLRSEMFGSGNLDGGSHAIFPVADYDYDTNTLTLTTPQLRSLYRYTVNVGIDLGAFDIDNCQLGEPSFSFTTLDGGQPHVVRTDPARGEKDVDPTKPITVTFSEPLDPATVGTGTFILYTSIGGSGGPHLAGRVTYDAATYSAIFTPAAPLKAATQYGITLAVVRDTSGVSMEGDFLSYFTTR